MLKYFKWSIIFSIIGIAIATLLAYKENTDIIYLLHVVFIVVVLSLLEISVSFDNAIVNASILKKMSVVWQKRFLSWGIIIAVFGMRIVFPIIIISISAKIGPIEAVRIATMDPVQYKTIMQDSSLFLSAFGGIFLTMVGINFFFNPKKDNHWVNYVEKSMQKLASFGTISTALALIILYSIMEALPQEDRLTFMSAGIMGLIVYLFIHGISNCMEAQEEKILLGAAKGGFASFMYLELLDASFSFDGVVAAFALTSNFYYIVIGLGIGAFFVRSMTIMLVERSTLNSFPFLENGAFWAILVLGLTMLSHPVTKLPEIATGGISLIILLISVISSIHENKKHENKK